MVIPVLEENTNKTSAYFPKAKWYNFADHSVIDEEGLKYITLDLPLDKIMVAIRGGSILALHSPGPNTVAARKGKFSLFTALDKERQAYGELFWDDGESLNKFKNATYCFILFSFENVNTAYNLLHQFN